MVINTSFMAMALPLVPVLAGPVFAQVTVGGAPMYADEDIVDDAVNSKEHTTLIAAVKAAGSVDTLKGPGPFTVFAVLPPWTVGTLSG